NYYCCSYTTRGTFVI
nr:immunoglobulin light chain junction region [Macaca mulatta]